MQVFAARLRVGGDRLLWRRIASTVVKKANNPGEPDDGVGVHARCAESWSLSSAVCC